MIQVLSMYPLTDAYRRRLEACLGMPIQARVAGSFRKPSLWATFKAFNTLRSAPLVLATEDPSAEALKSLLLTIGALFGKGQPRLFDHRWEEHRHSRWKAVTGIANVIWSSLQARWNNHRLRGQLGAIKGKWKPIPWKAGNQVAYLKTNLWFGLKAGGSVGHVAGVINGLTGIGKSICVYANEPQPLVDLKVGFHEIQTPSLCAYPSDFNLVTYHKMFLRQTRQQFATRPPDWIYQRLSVANFVGADLSRTMALPLVVEYNGSEVWIARNWGNPLRNEPFAVEAEEAMLRQASLVVAVSDVLGDELRERGIPEERIFVHPNCVDPGMFRPDLLSHEEIISERAILGIPGDALVVTFLGTFGPWHGVLFLAKALQELYAMDGDWLKRHRVHFLLVGDGNQRGEVVQILQGLPGITFTGLVPQASAPGYLAISDIFLSPHIHVERDLRFFGSPTKIFEYMAMGRAILASELEQIGEILSPALRKNEDAAGATAYLFEPGNQADFLLGLKRLVEDPALRIRLGRGAREKVLSEYTWQCYAQNLTKRLGTLQFSTPSSGIN